MDLLRGEAPQPAEQDSKTRLSRIALEKSGAAGKPQSFLDRLLLPAAIGLSAVIVVLLIYQWLLTQPQIKVRSVADSELSSIRNNLESEMASRISILQHLAQFWHGKKETDATEWESNASLVLSSSPGLNAIVCLDRGLNTVGAVRRHPTDAPPTFDFPSDARSETLLQATAHEPATLVSHSVQLNNGKKGFLVIVPIVSKGIFQGALIGIYNYEELLGPIVSGVTRDDLVSIDDGQHTIFTTAEVSNTVSGTAPLAEDASVGQLSWKVHVAPKPETLARAQSILPELILVAGLQMAALLAFTTYSVETARVRARQLSLAHEQLKKEIAEREKVQEDLRHAHKMEAVGQLAGGVAHSFNNLLLVIRGHAELLLNLVAFSETLEGYPKEILKATESASTLTRQLLAFSRKQILQPKMMDLNTLISQTAVLLPPLLGPDIKLMLSLAPDLGKVKADPGQMEQVIMNLVVNARDAMPYGGVLKIETANEWSDKTNQKLSSKRVLLTVKDNGCGMDEKTRSRIFEPFFSTKETGKGTGLGMSMVYGTVEQSGGSIKVNSEPGRGTSVAISLPLVEELTPVSTGDVAGKIPAANFSCAETVLVVDDEDAVRRITREFLKIKGYSVLEARAAKEAISIAEHHSGPIHIVLTDVVMPGVKGAELAEQIIALRPDVKVLFMSAYTEDAVLNLGILAPGTNFIEKPFGPDELAYKVQTILHGRQPKGASAMGTRAGN